MVGLEPGGPGGTLWERVKLCGGFVSLLLFSQGRWGRGVWGGGGWLCLGCPACEPPSHWVSLVPPPFSRPKQSRTCSLRPWPRVEGTWPEPGQPDASTGARCLKCASQRSGESLEFLPCSGKGSFQRPEPGDGILTGCTHGTPGPVPPPWPRFCGSSSILLVYPSSA